MALLYLLLVFILIIIVGVLSMAGSIIRSIFGAGRSVFGNKSRNRSAGKDDSRANPSSRTTYERRAKVFGPHEGEYVDFEEVKENDQ